MPQKWSIEFCVEGDLRFLSHHDMMRAMERLCRRAGLPLKYSQGFNPRPVLSLAMPRPVGVASRSELLVLSLEGDIMEQTLLKGVNNSAPAGMRAFKAAQIAGKNPRARRATYELPLEPARLPAIQARLEELSRTGDWPADRRTVPKGARNNSQATTSRIDLRPLVEELRLEGELLVMALAPRGDVWARPAEVLALLGLDGRVDLARVTRTRVDYGLTPSVSAGF